MPIIVMTPEFIALTSGTILSLVFSYIPGLNVKFAALPEETKRLYMLVLNVFVVSVVFGLGCLGTLQITNFVCDQNTIIQYAYLLILSMVANQSVFKLSPKTKGVLIAKIAT